MNMDVKEHQELLKHLVKQANRELKYADDYCKCAYKFKSVQNVSAMYIELCKDELKHFELINKALTEKLGEKAKDEVIQSFHEHMIHWYEKIKEKIAVYK